MNKVLARASDDRKAVGGSREFRRRDSSKAGAGGAGGRDEDVEMAHAVNGPAVLACWPGFGSPEPT